MWGQARHPEVKRPWGESPGGRSAALMTPEEVWELGAGQRPTGTRGVLEVLLSGGPDLREQSPGRLVELSVEAGAADDAAAQRAGRGGGPVLGQRSETRLTEDVSAGPAAVRTEEDVQTHGAGQTVSVHVLRVQR